MGLETVLEFAASQGVWCALFIWLFFSSRQDSKERKKRLMNCLDMQGEQMKIIAGAPDNILAKLDGK